MIAGSIHQLRRRIRSTHNLAQVTRAMQTVAASKLRKVQQQVTEARPYSRWSKQFLEQLGAGAADIAASNPLLAQPQPVHAALVVIISSDRGLCGSYNQNIIREALLFARAPGAPQVTFITVGRKGRDLLSRLGYPILAHFELPRGTLTFDYARSIARQATAEFLAGHVQAVYLAYTRFRNILTHVPQLERYLPLSLPDTAPAITGGFSFEPSPEAVLGAFLPRALETRVYQALLEATTSEQAARMVAMENASRNAETMVQELTVAYNKARQQRITREILDIASGAEALAQHTGNPGQQTNRNQGATLGNRR